MSRSIALNLNGYTDLPPGHIASVVTFLEMRAPPPPRPPQSLVGAAIARLDGRDEPRYTAIYRQLGERWMWFSRLGLSAATRTDILDDPAVETFAFTLEGQDAGLLELDFRVPGEAELAYFGVVESATGTRAGRWLMARALDIAWARSGLTRLWLHTCNLDHPRALEFSRRSGFAPYKTAIEVAPDPRLSGLLPRDAAPHAPIARGPVPTSPTAS